MVLMGFHFPFHSRLHRVRKEHLGYTTTLNGSEAQVSFRKRSGSARAARSSTESNMNPCRQMPTLDHPGPQFTESSKAFEQLLKCNNHAPEFRALIRRIDKDVLLPGAAVEVQETANQFNPARNPPGANPEEMKVSDLQAILKRDRTVNELWHIHGLWERQLTGVDRRGTFSTYANIDGRKEAFHRACYDLWTFNYRFYRFFTVVEQISANGELNKSKNSWLRDLKNCLPHRVQNLAELVHFLEELVVHEWETMPEEVLMNTEYKVVTWAQEAVIAWGPDLAVWLYSMKERELERSDFKIGHMFQQTVTLPQMLEQLLEVKEL